MENVCDRLSWSWCEFSIAVIWNSRVWSSRITFESELFFLLIFLSTSRHHLMIHTTFRTFTAVDTNILPSPNSFLMFSFVSIPSYVKRCWSKKKCRFFSTNLKLVTSGFFPLLNFLVILVSIHSIAWQINIVCDELYFQSEQGNPVAHNNRHFFSSFAALSLIIS